MKHPYLRLLGALATLLACLSSHAATTQPITQLHHIRLHLSGSLGDFYLLYGVDSDPAHLASVQQRVAQTNQLLNQLTPPTDENGMQALQQLHQHWPAYQALLQELGHSLLQQQTPTGGAIAELIQLNHQLTRLADTLHASYPTAANPLATHSRELAMQLQTLNTDYLAHSVGANALGGDNPALDVQSAAFGEGLEQLLLAHKSGEAQTLLQSIQRTWRYIEPSLQHYQQNNVPTLVDRYSRKIIDDLQQLPTLAQPSQ